MTLAQSLSLTLAGRPVGSGAPLTTVSRSVVGRWVASATRRENIVGTACSTVTRRSSMRRRAWAVSKRGIRAMAAPARTDALSTALMPKEWGRGRAPSWTSCSSRWSISPATARALCSSAAWEGIAARGVPGGPGGPGVPAGALGGALGGGGEFGGEGGGVVEEGGGGGGCGARGASGAGGAEDHRGRVGVDVGRCCAGTVGQCGEADLVVIAGVLRGDDGEQCAGV